MSHLISSTIRITDLDILKRAVAGFGGLRFNENVKTFESYFCHRKGESSGKCMDEQLASQGTIEHSITILNGSNVEDGRGYEIGVLRAKDGEGYILSFDPYDSRNAKIVGAKCERVMIAYAEAMIRDHAERNGFSIDQSFDEEGHLILTMTGN